MLKNELIRTNLGWWIMFAVVQSQFTWCFWQCSKRRSRRTERRLHSCWLDYLVLVSVEKSLQSKELLMEQILETIVLCTHIAILLYSNIFFCIFLRLQFAIFLRKVTVSVTLPFCICIFRLTCSTSVPVDCKPVVNNVWCRGQQRSDASITRFGVLQDCVRRCEWRTIVLLSLYKARPQKKARAAVASTGFCFADVFVRKRDGRQVVGDVKSVIGYNVSLYKHRHLQINHCVLHRCRALRG